MEFVQVLLFFCAVSTSWQQTPKPIVARLSHGRADGCINTNYESSNPLGPIVECSTLPEEFVDCDDPQLVQQFSAAVNISISEEGKCKKFGGQRAEDVEWTTVNCRALPCIECSGERVFQRPAPCLKYTGHYFLSTVLYSVFLGVVAVDRFCLGYSAIAVGKLMTLGGLGIWWIVDICLLVTGNLMPADESNWEPTY
ncbi:unnamed protein product [Caenorhabditis auriculariae]|uniref:TM2 domain-containing protein n=1 Tax=Caenorhabditis auriculariae TaxID=2777116 RepID=A0A8S1GXX0_9PELO|nr:unnamed protein product [Caenorhabditis auriculariae]